MGRVSTGALTRSLRRLSISEEPTKFKAMDFPPVPINLAVQHWLLGAEEVNTGHRHQSYNLSGHLEDLLAY